MHLIRTNLEENIKDNTKINFNNNLYILPSICENPAILNCSSIVTELFYEEINKENKLSKCEIIKSNSQFEILLCILICDSIPYVKIYSINFCQQNFENFLAINCVKTVFILNMVFDIFPINLFEKNIKHPNICNLAKKVLFYFFKF